MSVEQAEKVEALLRDGPLDLGGELSVQRPLLEQLMTSHALPPGIRITPSSLGALPAVEVTSEHGARTGTVLYLHGGGYALGSALAGAGLAAELGTRTGMRAVSLEYRLAPENPYPAALDDAIAAYTAVFASGADPTSIAVVGESAGGGLALALLLGRVSYFVEPADDAVQDEGVAVDRDVVDAPMDVKRLIEPWVQLWCW